MVVVPIYSAQWGGGRVWTYSIRPDLWPLGHDMALKSEGHTWWWSWWDYTAHHVSGRARNVVAQGHHAPGVAEALILAGCDLVNGACEAAPGPDRDWEAP